MAGRLLTAAWPRAPVPVLAAGTRRTHRSRSHVVRCFANADGTVSVSFRLPYRCSFGQTLCVIGADQHLGAWDVAHAVPMTWTTGDEWVVEMHLPADGGAQLEYKYVVRCEEDKSAVRWKEGSNFTLQLPLQGRLRVRDTWDESSREVEVEDVQPAVEAPPPPLAPVEPPPPPPPPPSPAAAAPVQAAMQQPAAAAPSAPAASSSTAADAAAEAVPGASPQRRQRRKKDEDAEAITTIARAADKAMRKLDDAVTRSMDLLTLANDPAAPELLANDRLVAAAARHATTLNKALDSAKELKMLPQVPMPPVGRGGSSSGGAKPGKPVGQRRRRAASKKDGGQPDS